MKYIVFLFMPLIFAACMATGLRSTGAIPSEKLPLAPQDINAIDEHGMTPLANAVWQSRDIVKVRQLIRNGADVHSRNSEGLTILELALCTDQKEIINELINAGAKLTEPAVGKARLLFIGEGLLLVDTWVSVGDLHKNFKQGRIDFIDVDPGRHRIVVPVSWYQTQPKLDISVTAGNTYYFSISPTGSHTASIILGGLIPAIMSDRIGETGPFSINPLNETIAKEKIYDHLNAGLDRRDKR